MASSSGSVAAITPTRSGCEHRHRHHPVGATLPGHHGRGGLFEAAFEQVLVGEGLLARDRSVSASMRPVVPTSCMRTAPTRLPWFASAERTVGLVALRDRRAQA
jgi:hypothetical protein